MQLIDLDDIRTDGGTQSRAVIDEATVAEYAAAIADGVTLPDAVVFYDGKDYWLADGFHRFHAAIAGDYLELACDVRQGTQRDAVLFSVGANAAHGLRRSNDDKRRAVRTLLADEEWRRWSDREIAKRCAVDHKTVAALRAELSGELPQIGERLVERNGTTYPMATAAIGRSRAATAPDPEPRWSQDERPRMPDRPMSALERAAGPEAALIAEESSGAWTADQADRLKQAEAEIERLRAHIAKAEAAPEKKESRDGDEWYTPEHIIKAARIVSGTFDLDPASCALANETVKAAKFYALADDGLSQPWRGRVWLNPPFSNTEAWIEKLVEAYRAGKVTEAIVLCNAKTETAWFNLLFDASPVLCLVRGRLSFTPGDGGPSQTGRHGQVIAYLGRDHACFADVFGPHGRLISTSQPQSIGAAA